MFLKVATLIVALLLISVVTSTATGFPAGGETTAAGGQTTAAGGETTAAGGQTTAAGGQTTAAGGQTTAAGGETTAAGGQTTAAGGQTTAAGGETTAAGGQTTAAGGETSAAPVETQTAAPTDPALPEGVYGFKVFLNKATSWYYVRRDLGQALCGSYSSYCSRVTDGDFWLPFNQDTGKNTEFLVAVNVSWMLYAVEATPVEIINDNNSGRYNSTKVIQFKAPALDQRGPNQVQFNTTRTSWYSFPSFRSNVVGEFSNVNVDDSTLVDMSCENVGTLGTTKYNCTFIVSFKYISTQVQMAAAPWSYGYSFRDNYVKSAELYPIGVDLDTTTANQLGNRVFFAIYNKNRYNRVDFGTFVVDTLNYTLRQNDDIAPKNLFVQEDQVNLVDAVITYDQYDDDYFRYNYTVSFATVAQAKKLIALVKAGKEDSRGWIYVLAAETAASPALITPSPTTTSGKAAKKDDDGKKSKVPIIVGVVIAVVIVIVVIAIVAKKQSGTGTKDGQEDYVAMNSNSQV